MKAKAIVYTSKTGSSEQYARMLGAKLNLPVYERKMASNYIAKGCEIIYVAWVMAGLIKDYGKVKAMYDISAIIAVGMDDSKGAELQMRLENELPVSVPLYLVQGGYNKQKLKGFYKWTYKQKAKGWIKELEEQDELTPKEADLLDLLKNGGSRVKEENLRRFIKDYNK